MISPATDEFSKIPATDYTKSAEFLIKHYTICTEQQKDALMMSAFDLQLDNRTETAKQVVHQALLLQYIANLTGNNPHAPKDKVINAIKLFFSKISDESTPAHQVFWEDVDRTYAHIKTDVRSSSKKDNLEVVMMMMMENKKLFFNYVHWMTKLNYW